MRKLLVPQMHFTSITHFADWNLIVISSQQYTISPTIEFREFMFIFLQKKAACQCCLHVYVMSLCPTHVPFTWDSEHSVCDTRIWLRTIFHRKEISTMVNVTRFQIIGLNCAWVLPSWKDSLDMIIMFLSNQYIKRYWTISSKIYRQNSNYASIILILKDVDLLYWATYQKARSTYKVESF